MGKVWGVMVAASLLIAWNVRAEPPPGTSPSPLPNLTVDLHAHLSMKPGLGWLFRGSFDEPLRATAWDDRLSSKANAQTLKESGVGVMVVALFAHPIFARDLRQAVREQMKRIENFVRRNPSWVVARDALSADHALRQGKRVIVFSLEGAAGILESEADLQEFIDRRGIAIVTPLHLTDDRYGGAALLEGAQQVANPLTVVDGHATERKQTKRGSLLVNRLGLTPTGMRLIEALMERGVWIDLTHASDRALAQLVPKLERAGQPLLFTHTSPRHFRRAERALSDEMLEAVSRSGGMVGLLPSEQSMGTKQAQPHPHPHPHCGQGAPTGSMNGVDGLVTLYRYLAARMPARAIALGSDFNGAMRHLSPGCGSTQGLDGPGGFYHLGQTPLLWKALTRKGAPVAPAAQTLSHFLRAWGRVRTRGAIAPKRAEPRPAVSSLPVVMGGLAAGIIQRRQGEAGRPWVGWNVRFYKDGRPLFKEEPAVYLGDVRGAAALSMSGAGRHQLRLKVAAAGVVAERGAALLDGRLGVGAFERAAVVGRTWQARLMAAQGRARFAPGWLSLGTGKQGFVGVKAGGLGYRGMESTKRSGALHGAELVDLTGEVGVKLVGHPAARVSVQGWGGLDVALLKVEQSLAPMVDLTVGTSVDVRRTPNGARFRLLGEWRWLDDPLIGGRRLSRRLGAFIAFPLNRQGASDR